MRCHPHGFVLADVVPFGLIACSLLGLSVCCLALSAAGTPTGTNKGRLAQLVFSNPFVGKAVAMCAAARTGGPTAVGLHYAHLDLHSASLGALSIRSPEGVLETHYHPEIGDDDVESPAHESLPVGAVLAYDSSVATGIARLRGIVGCGGLSAGTRHPLHTVSGPGACDT